MSDLAHQAVRQLRSIFDKARRLVPGKGPDDASRRWNVVTIEGSPGQLAPAGQLPLLLAELGAAVEVQVRPAPAGKGTELAARLTGTPPAAGDPDLTQGNLRQVLRRVKQLSEVGEVLQSVPRPEGKRPPTPTGLLVDRAEQKSDEEGVL